MLMAQLREIKNRMGAVKTIARITKTMQMIATAKYTAAGQRAQQSRPYAAMIDDMVRQVASNASDYESPLIDGPGEKTGKALLLVICSDRGLCGAYNANVLRTANKHRQAEIDSTDVVIETAGKKASAFFKFQGIEVSRAYGIGDTPQYDDVEAIAQDYLDRYLAGEYDTIKIVSMRYHTVSRQTAEVTQLLPLSQPESGDEATSVTSRQDVYDFTPSASELLDTLLPTTVKTLLYQLFIEAAVSEHVMRMIAMKAATDNARDFGRTLARTYNRARQGQITTELTEIVSGVAALEG
ncbi:MAG TPA: ATP synthase F1 subunit gamma [Phycisphaerales bacterium]|nr:ATP synthase F1 subunit gamma [Phycisphaerales bacterium]